MIKLIACDMDGTLLKEGAQEVSETMYDTILSLKKKGILFVAASGRQYPNLKKLFNPILNEIAFIAENGSAILYKEEEIELKVMDKAFCMEIINEISKIEGAQILVSCIDSLYILRNQERFFDILKNKVNMEVAEVNSFEELNNIIKVSLYKEDGVSNEQAMKLKTEWSDKCFVMTSGLTWLDFGITNKGEALNTLSNYFNIKAEETVAFGDNYNDVHMLEIAGTSFAMQNAPDRVKQAANGICNDVEETIKKLYLN